MATIRGLFLILCLAVSRGSIAQTPPAPPPRPHARVLSADEIEQEYRNRVIEKQPVFSITATAEKNPVKAGADLWVDVVVLKNTSSHDIKVGEAKNYGPEGAQVYYRLQVVDSKGIAVPFTENGDPAPQG